MLRYYANNSIVYYLSKENKFLLVVEILECLLTALEVEGCFSSHRSRL